MLTVVRCVAWIGAAAWIGLAVARGRFWDAGADGLRASREGDPVPDVHAVVPARNEADVLAATLRSLLTQEYRGPFAVTLVDDRSEDGTGEVARATIASCGAEDRARVAVARPRPEGWTGKVWALHEGLEAARAGGARPAFWWFTDADVEHAPDTLARLVATARDERRALVSQMVALHCRSGWERLLIPAFEFFFRLLYPFSWVNDDRRRTAAAAGGSILLAADALEKIGGIARIRGELIDDCSLAAAVKRDAGGVWLGLATRSRSVRPYGSLETIWSMVARTAYTQLRYSPLLLALTVAGMIVLFVAAPFAAIGGTIARRWDVAAGGALAWATMSALYVPTLRRYRVGGWEALALPAAAALYTAMTVDSARRHARGRGGTWKGRAFTPARE
jgi:hopene-associated glycosyltransferase HpnB